MRPRIHPFLSLLELYLRSGAAAAGIVCALVIGTELLLRFGFQHRGFTPDTRALIALVMLLIGSVVIAVAISTRESPDRVCDLPVGIRLVLSAQLVAAFLLAAGVLVLSVTVTGLTSSGFDTLIALVNSPVFGPDIRLVTVNPQSHLSFLLAAFLVYILLLQSSFVGAFTICRSFISRISVPLLWLAVASMGGLWVTRPFSRLAFLLAPLAMLLADLGAWVVSKWALGWRHTYLAIGGIALLVLLPHLAFLLNLGEVHSFGPFSEPSFWYQAGRPTSLDFVLTGQSVLFPQLHRYLIVEANTGRMLVVGTRETTSGELWRYESRSLWIVKDQGNVQEAMIQTARGWRGIALASGSTEVLEEDALRAVVSPLKPSPEGSRVAIHMLVDPPSLSNILLNGNKKMEINGGRLFRLRKSVLAISSFGGGQDDPIWAGALGSSESVWHEVGTGTPIECGDGVWVFAQVEARWDKEHHTRLASPSELVFLGPSSSRAISVPGSFNAMTFFPVHNCQVVVDGGKRELRIRTRMALIEEGPGAGRGGSRCRWWYFGLDGDTSARPIESKPAFCRNDFLGKYTGKLVRQGNRVLALFPNGKSQEVPVPMSDLNSKARFFKRYQSTVLYGAIGSHISMFDLSTGSTTDLGKVTKKVGSSFIYWSAPAIPDARFSLFRVSSGAILVVDLAKQKTHVLKAVGESLCTYKRGNGPTWWLLKDQRTLALLCPSSHNEVLVDTDTYKWTVHPWPTKPEHWFPPPGPGKGSLQSANVSRP